MSLAEIYHHVLAQSPSPEAAKISIRTAHQNGRLHFRCERRERKALPGRLKPKEDPPEATSDIVADCLVAWGAFQSWDWERNRAMRRNPKTASLFEYIDIVGQRDHVLELWPMPSRGLVPAIIQQLDAIERERETGLLGLSQKELKKEVSERLGRTIALRSLQTALAIRRRRTG